MIKCETSKKALLCSLCARNLTVTKWNCHKKRKYESKETCIPVVMVPNETKKDRDCLFIVTC